MLQWRELVNIGLATVLALLLIWGFSPVSTGVRCGLTFLILLIAIIGSIHRWHQFGIVPTEDSDRTIILPPESFAGPVVLVGGDSESLFVGRASSCECPQGWYLNASTPTHFLSLVRKLAAERPGLLMRVSVMLALIPEHHNDEDALRQMITGWRRVVAQSRHWLPGVPPLWLCCWVNTFRGTSDTRWFIRTHQYEEIHSATGLDDLTSFSAEDKQARHFYLIQAIWLDNLMKWLSRIQDDTDHHASVLFSTPRVICFTPLESIKNNLLQQYVVRQTTLPMVGAVIPGILPFPDLALPFLSRSRALSAFQRMVGVSGLLCGLFVALAMVCSFINNQYLIRITQDHLVLYHRLSVPPVQPKIQAQEQLRRDVLRLERWYQQGEPLSLSVGLYQGMRLVPPLKAAISDWTPPALSKATVPQTVRLDSMSLFDTGQWALKPGSTKILIAALVNIKARPGWLIVVAGHTDDVGDDKSNQQLSLRRAESVRNWMRDTGDVSESCFAVQGYGESRPYQSNNTAEGRAANRRVEISLVPEADACQVPGMKEPSPKSGDGLAK
ncbi:OmpA family protein [Enterobacter sp.]|uniref:OmpA family protein n=1 Tax=Enterobacter sp. TaxID=42895 RepID=UPI00296ECB8B|nr:OmpA family protein [Enterobacter sp.]